jgi:hypothetical protein
MTGLSSMLLSVTLLIMPPGLWVTDCPRESSAPAATVVRSQSVPPLFRVTRRIPWLIPGESQFNIVLKTSIEKVNGALVESKTFQCSGEFPLTEVEFYYVRSGGELYVNPLLLAVQHISSYSIGGRTFAYRVALAKVNVRSDGSREYIGAIFTLYYYDEDGDGKFETRYGDLTSLKLPDWYKGK